MSKRSRFVREQRVKKKAAKLAAMRRGEDPSERPTKYRLRQQARRNGKPMASRPYPSKWLNLCADAFAYREADALARRMFEEGKPPTLISEHARLAVRRVRAEVLRGAA